MPTRTSQDQKQMPLNLFPDEVRIDLSPSQERELDRALADLLLKHQPGKGERAGGER